jgi:uncharacterized membrane protein
MSNQYSFHTIRVVPYLLMSARRLLLFFLSNGTDFKKLYSVNIVHYEAKNSIKSCQIGAPYVSIVLNIPYQYIFQEIFHEKFGLRP